MRNFVMFVGVAVALTGCDMLGSSESASEMADQAAAAAEGAADEAAEAAGAAAEAMEAAAEQAASKLSDAVNDAAANMGKDVTIAGHFVSTAVGEGDEGATVTLAASAEEGAPTLTCMVSKDNRAQFENMEANAMVQVKGTMGEKDGIPMLQNCVRADAAAPAAEADAAEGDHAEGDDHGDEH